VGEFAGGTGRFEGIKEGFSYTTKGYNQYSKEPKETKNDAIIDCLATYTLPKK